MDTKSYGEEQLLMLSGVQHYAFCKRQWSLIHVEQLWAENVLTYEGRQLHKRADDPYFSEKRGDVLVSRAMPLACYSHGFYGVADVVEFHAVVDQQESGTVTLPGRTGSWRPFPVEYKRGKPKSGDWDEVQLCAQGMAMEEMFGIPIREGALYYGERERRVRVIFDETLRERTTALFEEMHRLLAQGATAKARYSAKCKSCSLLEICEPKGSSKQSHFYLENYLKHCRE
ncbi:CRISPR-associated protein Cas4 [Paenibacillus sp. RC84]|uniref:CRISPR-associated protein Cas4 n=1 Tax=Paenibacillus sp. RC84 TaxID=3156252 RepID=UPI003516E937